MVDVIVNPTPPAPMVAPAASERSQARRETLRVLIIGIVYMVATLIADMVTAWMNPRIRLDAER